MKISFFGIGYVGLVQGTIFAEVGHDVICYDIDNKKVEDLNKSIIPIYEPGLSRLIEKNVIGRRLRFTNSLELAVSHGEAIFIAVGTPPNEDGSADLNNVLHVAESIARYMNGPKIIINKSTVPVGTADKVRNVVKAVLMEVGKKLDFEVVSNPEFLKEGNAVDDSMRPDRIIIGADNPDVIAKMRELYEPFTRNHDCVMIMDVRSAELTKYAANCMLATKISFMNEMATIAERLGADIEKVRRGIGADRRIGYDFLYPGCGYGGSCFPKDVSALVQTAEASGFVPDIIHAVERTNKRQKQKLFSLINLHFDGNLSGKTIALWGLSFKPNTDDMREAPSRTLMESLWASGAKVQAFDPEAMREARRIYGERDKFVLCDSKEDALREADALAICTDWGDFKAPDFAEIKSLLRNPVIFDGRNLYEPARLVGLGFIYYGIGRGVQVKCSK